MRTDTRVERLTQPRWSLSEKDIDSDQIISKLRAWAKHFVHTT
jgi:hypothetical protein